MIGQIAVGFLASLVGSMVGIGGGVIIVPALTILLHIDIKEAIGSSLISIVAMSSMASAAYAKKGWVHFQLGYVLVLSTLVGSIIGSNLALKASNNLLALIFGLFLILPAALLLRKPKEQTLITDDVALMPHRSGRITGQFSEFGGQRPIAFIVRRVKTQIVLLTASGLFSGLLGIGGGILNVPVINQIGRVPFKMAAATSTLIMGLTSLMAVIVFLGSGAVNSTLSANVVIGAVIGAYLGPKLATRLQVRKLILMLVVLIVISSARMIYRALESGL